MCEAVIFLFLQALSLSVQIDFASRDCQIAFFESMEMAGQLRPGDRPEEISGRGVVACQSFTTDR